MPGGNSYRSITAARAAAAERIGPRAATDAPASLALIIYGHTEAEREAATDYLRGQEQFADEWSDDGPLWHGWAVYEVFMAGLDYSRREEKTDEPQQNNELSQPASLDGDSSRSGSDGGPVAQGGEPAGGRSASAGDGPRLRPAARLEAV